MRRHNYPKSFAAGVIAAGGIADGRGVAAAFMLGACGVQMGTRFLSAEECSIHPVYKERILKANDLCTMVTGKRLGHPVRSLRTNFARNYAKAEYGGMDDEALEALGSGALRKAVFLVLGISHGRHKNNGDLRCAGVLLKLCQYGKTI